METLGSITVSPEYEGRCMYRSCVSLTLTEIQTPGPIPTSATPAD